MREGRRIPFDGSWYGCRAVISTHVFPPGHTISHRFEMRAVLYAEHPGDVEGRLAPRGWYAVTAEFDMRDAAGDKPTIARVLQVK